MTALRRPALTAAVTITLGAAIVGSGSVGADAGPPTCRGERATIVGAPGYAVQGTAGRDVVVTVGATVVTTGGGDDLVCVTGSPPKRVEVKVLPGRGRDLVDTTAATRGTFVVADLGGGRDTYVGGPSRDEVDGGGSDEAGDSIRLGPGPDTYANLDHGLDDVQGGPGPDRLVIGDTDEDESRSVFDARNGEALRDGRLTLRWGSFESYLLNPQGRSASFIGSDRPERVATGFLPQEDLDLDLGDGNDRLEFGTYDVTPHLTVDGGPGRDQVVAVYDNRAPSDLAVVDLPRHRAVFPAAGLTPVVPVRGVEDWLLVDYLEVRFTGSDGYDRLTTVHACNVRATGGPGDDRLATTRGFTYGDSCSSRLRGGGGDDSLSGARFDDLLVGGPGRDTAAGNTGDDRCVAEVRRRCER